VKISATEIKAMVFQGNTFRRVKIVITNETVEQVKTSKYVTTWNRVLEKLVSTQLVKKSPVFYGTGRCSAVFTRCSHWTLPSASAILIFSFHLGLCLARDPFPSCFSTEMLYMFLTPQLYIVNLFVSDSFRIPESEYLLVIPIKHGE
jgi:hypothetical protein